MTNERATELLCEVKRALDESFEYPECAAVLDENIIGYNEDVTFLEESPFKIAQMLFDSDSLMVMHPLVASYCIEVFSDEYAAGNAQAATDLGNLYYTGRAGAQDIAKAVEYYQFAADKGNRQAQESLGYCYYYGNYVEQDYEKAFNYFVLGALDGELKSLYKVGDCYRNGYYVKKDEKEAFRIYDRCAGAMTEADLSRVGADVYTRLADCFFKGIGTGVNLDNALRLYQMAEGLYYIRFRSGDYYVKENLEKVLKAQDEVRSLLMASVSSK